MSCEVCKGYTGVNCPVCGSGLYETCPNCKGTGEGDWQVFDIYTREVIGCTENAYLIAADDEDIAESKGQRYCKFSDVCQTCKGDGVIRK